MEFPPYFLIPYRNSTILNRDTETFLGKPNADSVETVDNSKL